MAIKREQIIVDIGGDAAKLLREFNVSKQAANTWARDTARELTQGRLPEAWRNYTGNIKDAVNQTKDLSKESTGFFSGIGKLAGAAVGWQVFKKAINEARQALVEVAGELAKINKEWNAAPYLKKQRESELRGINRNDRESIIAGNAATEGWWNGIKDKLAVGAGNAALVADILKQKATGTGAAGYGISWADASDRAVKNQQELISGIRIASLEEEQAARDKAKAEKEAIERKKLDELRAKNFAEYENRMRERNQRAEKERTEEFKKQLELRKEIANQKTSLGMRFNANLRQEFQPTLEELGEAGIFKQDAQRLMFLQNDTRDKARWGNKAGVERNLDEITSIRSRLSKAGVYTDPNQALIDEFRLLTDPVKNKGGLPVKVQLAK
jgi:hypothetical protein